MQRVKEIRRKKDCTSLAAKQTKSARIVMNSDILFLLSRAHPNIKRALPKLTASFGQAGLQSRTLKVEHSYSFDTSLRFYVNLRQLHIKNASTVHLRAMEGKNLDTLVLDSVSRIDLAEACSISVRHLILKSIKMSPKDLICMLDILAPRSLKLVDLHFRGDSNEAVHQALMKIMMLDLWSIEIEDSFIGIDKFLHVVREKRLKRFCFASADKLLSCSYAGVSLSHLVLKGIDGRILKSTLDLVGDIDVLVLKTQQSYAGIPSDITRGARYFVLEGLSICSQLLKRFGKPVSIILRQCNFDSLCFYEFVDLFRGSLRYLSFKHMEMPLDCVGYMKKKLSDCMIELNGNSSFYVSENAMNRK